MESFAWLRRMKWLAIAVIASFAIAAVASADTGPAHKVRQTRPIELGTSGGNINHFEKAFCYGGTLGSLVQKSDSSRHILSNNHVLARTNKASTGEDIVQPGLIDVSCQKITADVVADLSAFVPIQFKKKGVTPNNTVDAAIAGVRLGAVRSDGSILDIGTLSNLTALDKVDCTVQKSGRTTGHTTGTISAVDVTVDINYGSGKVARFVDQFLISDGDFSAGGDSGSLVVRDGGTSPRAVGLLFAGSSSYTIANPIAAVLNALGVTMVGSGDGGDCPDSGVTTTAAAAKGRHQEALLQVPGVVGVGVGRGGQVEIYLANDNAQSRARIPSHVDGVPVRIVVTGEFHAR